MTDQIGRPWQTFALVGGGSFLGTLAAALLLWWLCGCHCANTVVQNLPIK
jgi:hypothetical protein